MGYIALSETIRLFREITLSPSTPKGIVGLIVALASFLDKYVKGCSLYGE